MTSQCLQIESTKENSPLGAVRGDADERSMVKMVMALMTDGVLQRRRDVTWVASTEASIMAAAICPVAPVVNKHYKAGSSTNSIVCGEFMAVLVSDVRLGKVSDKPVRVVEGLFEYLEIRDHLWLHYCCDENEN